MLQGRVAVITGGASGIGAACCREFKACGATVVVLDRNAAAATAVAEDIGGVAYSCDIAIDDQLAETARRIEQEVGPVSALVNCAAVVQGRAGPYDLSMRKWDEIVRVDQRGTFVSCLTFARPMLERRAGSIVNIASVAGLRAMPMHAYGPAKAAVIAMTESLAGEWGPYAVRVNAVSPGFTRTEGVLAAITAGKVDVKAITDSTALGRLVEPSEIARTVAFLASDRAAAITGVNLPVDCGWLAASTWPTYGGLSPVTPA